MADLKGRHDEIGNESRRLNGQGTNYTYGRNGDMTIPADELSDDDVDDDDDDASAHTLNSKRSVKRRKTAAGGDMADDADPDGPLLEAKEYKARLFRRNMILEDVRKAYLRDVVFLKQIMVEMFNDEDRREVMAQYESMLPSLDMRQVGLWADARTTDTLVLLQM